MKNVIVQIPCVHCRKKIDITVSKEGLKKRQAGAHIQDAFPELAPELRKMFISQTCPTCWNRLFGMEGEYEEEADREEENPAYSKDKVKDYLFDDAVRMAEFRFRKPYSRFGESEIKYLHRLYNKADDNRISLKIYPASSNPQNKSFLAAKRKYEAARKRINEYFSKAKQRGIDGSQTVRGRRLLREAADAERAMGRAYTKLSSKELADRKKLIEKTVEKLLKSEKFLSFLDGPSEDDVDEWENPNGRNIMEYLLDLDPGIVPITDWCAQQYIYRVMSHDPKVMKDEHFREIAKRHEKRRSEYEKKFSEALLLGMNRELNLLADSVFSEMNSSVAMPKHLQDAAREIIAENFKVELDEIEERTLRPKNRPAYTALSFPINVPANNYVAFCELVFGLPKVQFSRPNPPSVVKTKEDEAKWRRAVRSTERRFKKKEKDFKEREWRYTMGTFKRMKHI